MWFLNKEFVIEGMSCSHCSSRVEKALSSIPGVNVKVDLQRKVALVSGDVDVADEVFRSSIEALGFVVVSIK